MEIYDIYICVYMNGYMDVYMDIYIWIMDNGYKHPCTKNTTMIDFISEDQPTRHNGGK